MTRQRMKGLVTRVRPDAGSGRLRVMAEVRLETGETVPAQVPDREVSALLPRSVLLGASTSAPLSLLDTLQPILVRMAEGREVRLWQYKDRWFLSFTAWKSVRFRPDEAFVEQAAAVEASPAPALP